MSRRTALASSTVHEKGFRVVTSAVVHATRGTARIVDVREPREFTGDLGHIADAFLVPLAELEAAAVRWGRDAPIVLVCRSGGRSAIAAELLVGMGFEAVMNLTGGMLAWTDAGLAVER